MSSVDLFLNWLAFAIPVLGPPLVAYLLFASAFWWRHYTKTDPNPQRALKWLRRTYVFLALAAALILFYIDVFTAN